jgi:hypothetical protein
LVIASESTEKSQIRYQGEEWAKVTITHRIRKDSPKYIIKGSKNAQRRSATGKDMVCVCLGGGVVVPMAMVSMVVVPMAALSMLVARMVVMCAHWHLVRSGPLFAFDPISDPHPSPTRGIRVETYPNQGSAGLAGRSHECGHGFGCESPRDRMLRMPPLAPTTLSSLMTGASESVRYQTVISALS